MVFIISMAQQKGGAGKTTLAAQIAVYFSQQGYRVGLVDADPQASLERWFHEREMQHPERCKNLTVRQAPGWRVTSEISRLRTNHDIIIIDNSSGLDMDTRTTMRHADLTIIPVQPSPADVWATEAIVDYAEKERFPVMLVMNRVTARSRLAGLFSSSLPFFSNTMVGNRIVFASALRDGLTAIEEAPRSVAAREISNLVAEVKKYMPKGMRKLRKKVRKESEFA